MLMVIFMRVNGKTIKLMATECSLTLIVLFMKEIGQRICSMVMELKAGIMGQLNIRDNSIKERRMVKEDLNGKTVAFTKVIL